MPDLKSAVLDPLTNPGNATPEARIDLIYTRYTALIAACRQQNVFHLPPWDAQGTPEPSRDDAVNFLARFLGAVEGENKAALGLQGDRAGALRHLRAQVTFWTRANFRRFHFINRFRYAIELALRVRRPRAVDQGQAVLCGAAAVYSGYLKHEPRPALKYALDLAETGQATLKEYRFSIIEDVVDSAAMGRNEMIPVDWVTLAGLRYHFEPLAWVAARGGIDSSTVDALRQLTKPGLLTSWLNNMGYRNVVDRTFGRSGFTWMPRSPAASPGPSCTAAIPANPTRRGTWGWPWRR